MIAIILFILAAQLVAAPLTPYEIRYPEINYQPPSLTEARDTLDNGIIVFFVPDNTLPVFDIQVRIKGGSIAELQNERGVSSATFSLLPNGGVKNITPDSLDELFEFNAISVKSGASTTEAVVTLSCISGKTDIALDLLYRLFTAPSFDNKKLRTTKLRMLDNIASRFDSPKGTLNILQSYGLYGKNKYSELLTKKDVNAISRKDILRFFERVATPGNMILAVSGRFDKETLFAKLNASFGSIGNESKTPVSYASLSVNSINGFLFVNRDNLTQASIKLGIITLQRPNPDYYPLTLMNWILGGAPFTSRISKKVREEEGLAYSAGSGLTSEYFYPGIFSAYLETKSSSAAYAVDLVYKEIEKFLYDGPTAEEISAAKQSLIDAFPASFKDAAVTASAFSQNQFAGESDNRFSTYRNRIAEITKEDIMRVAKKYLVKEHMTLTIVGNYRECMEGAMTKQDNFSNFKNVKLVTENDITRLLGD